MRSSEVMNELLENLSKKVSNLTNLKFDFFISDESHEEEKISGKINSISINKEINEKIIEIISPVIVNQLKIHFSDFNKATERMLDDFIEDICIELIFNTCRSDVENYNSVYIFLKQIEEIAHRTYENEAISTGVIILNEYQNVLDQLSTFNFEYISINKPIFIDDLIKIEKPLIKLIDGTSAAYVLTPDFKVVGFVRKKKNFLNIEEEVFNYFNQKIIKNIYTLILAHIKKIIQDQFNNKNKLIEEFSNMNLAKIIDLLQKIIEKNRVNLLDDIKEQDLNNIFGIKCYARLINKEIQWTFDHNSIISLKNNKWKIKQYTALISFFFDAIFLKNFILYSDLDTNKLEDEIKLDIEKITILFKVIKNMSEKNIGGLFVVLDEFDNDENLNSPINLVIERNNILNYKKILSRKNTKKQIINIVEIDDHLIEVVASIDGATILDSDLNILSFGEIIKSPQNFIGTNYGARTYAAINASYHGIAIKISEDGDIEIYLKGELKYKV